MKQGKFDRNAQVIPVLEGVTVCAMPGDLLGSFVFPKFWDLGGLGMLCAVKYTVTFPTVGEKD